MADEDAQPRPGLELLLDPAVAPAADLAVVEVGLGRVDRHDCDPADARDRVALAEQLLEVHVADVARVVVAGDDDERLALDPVEVALRLQVLVLEPEGRQVARADDDLRLEVVDLGDRAVEQARDEVLAAAVQVGEMRDREALVGGSPWAKHRSLRHRVPRVALNHADPPVLPRSREIRPQNEGFRPSKPLPERRRRRCPVTTFKH